LALPIAKTSIAGRLLPVQGEVGLNLKLVGLDVSALRQYLITLGKRK
jgi:hypothetical protein